MAEKEKSDVLTPEGEKLWRVSCRGEYYDGSDPMPGDVRINREFYVLAKNEEDAIFKADAGIAEVRGRSSKEVTIEASVIDIDSLVVARQDPEASYWSVGPVSLFYRDDKRRYRLGVRLIPVDQDK